MKIESFKRHKSNQGYIAAKYPAVLLYILCLIVSFIPVVSLFSFVLAFVFFFREYDSIFLRLHAAETGLLLLLRGILQVSVNLIEDFLFLQASRSQSNAAWINAMTWSEHLRKVQITLVVVSAAYLLIHGLLSYSYRYWQMPILGKLAKRLEENTRPGPLR